MFRSKFLLTAVVAVAAALAAPATSEAAYKVKIELFNASTNASLGSTTITDNVGPDTDGTVGTVDFNDTNLFGTNFSLKLTSFSNQSMPAGNPAQLQTQSVRLLDNDAAIDFRVVITTTNTSYTIPSPADPSKLVSTLQWSSTGNPAVAGTFQSFTSLAAGGTSEFDTTQVSTSLQNIASPGTVSTLWNRSGQAYSITNVMNISTTGVMGSSAAITGTSEVFSAPAPAGLVLVAGALPFAGLLRLRRRGLTTVPATAA
jgi:hypothetical protein